MKSFLVITGNNSEFSSNFSSSVEEQVKADTYTIEEQQDVNNIIVTVPDTRTPIVVFFGPQASGKTIALLRMIQFLKQKMHYSVVCERVFRPATDKHYQRVCDRLDAITYSPYTPGGTDVVSFMLIKVLNPVGKPLVQFLEAPG